MAVKWISDAARELGMDVLEAVELLASKQNYPMNGLLDEDRVLLLKRYRGEKKGVEGTGSHAVPPPPPKEAKRAEPPPVPKGRKDPGEVTSITTPIPTQPGERSEARTVIIPPPADKR